VCVCVFVGVCMCGFCNVWVCVCVGFVVCVFILFRLCVFILFTLLFNFVSYVFLLLCMFCSLYSVFIVPSVILRLPRLRFSVLFPQLYDKCQGITRKDGGTARLFTD